MKVGLQLHQKKQNEDGMKEYELRNGKIVLSDFEFGYSQNPQDCKRFNLILKNGKKSNYNYKPNGTFYGSYRSDLDIMKEIKRPEPTKEGMKKYLLRDGRIIESNFEFSDEKDYQQESVIVIGLSHSGAKDEIKYTGDGHFFRGEKEDEWDIMEEVIDARSTNIKTKRVLGFKKNKEEDVKVDHALFKKPVLNFNQNK